MTDAEERVRQVVAIVCGVSVGEVTRCVRLPQPGAVEVTVRTSSGDEACRLQPATAGAPRALVEVGGLAVSVRGDSSDWQLALLRRLAPSRFTPAHAAKVLEVIQASWRLLPEHRATEELRPAERASVQALGAERALYASSIQAFEHFYATSVEYYVDSSRHGVSLGVPEHHRYGFMGRMPAAPAVRQHLQALGFGSTMADRLNVVPSLGTFRERLADSGFDSAFRFVPYVRRRAAAATDADWMTALAGGTLLVQFTGPDELETVRAVPRGDGLGGGREHRHIHTLLYAPFHDLSTHGFAFHLMSEAQVRQLGDAALSKHAECPELSVELARFYENTLTQACMALWHRIQHPTEFSTAFAAELPGLCQQLRELQRLDDPHAHFVRYSGVGAGRGEG